VAVQDGRKELWTHMSSHYITAAMKNTFVMYWFDNAQYYTTKYYRTHLSKHKNHWCIYTN